MIATLGSVLDIGDLEGLSDQQIEERIDAVIETIPDMAGTFYRYSLSASLLGGRTQ
jgi:F420-non-reducing hydrogenase small subunit